MICKNCGKNIEIENQKFCSECGAPLTVPALESNPLKTVENTDATNILSETETRQVASSSDHSELIQPATKISFFNGIDAIIHSINAYEKLKPHAIDQSKLHNSFKQIVDMLVAGNSALTQFKQNNTCFDSVDENTINIGKCICNFQNNCNEVKSTISDSLNYDLIKKQGIFSFDFSLDPLSPFSMTIESPESNLDVTKFVEQILFSFINKDHKTKYRCIDLTANGSNFIHAHQLVKTTFELSGGKVYTTKRECTEIIDSLIKESATTVSTLGPISTLKEYNQNTTRKIDGLITIIFADQFNYNDDADKIRKLLKDSAKNGISFIIVGNKNLVKYFYDLSDYDIAYKNDTFFIDEDEYVSLVPSGTNTKPQANSATFEEDVIKKLETANKVDTVFSHHAHLVNQEYLKMSSEKMLRIPFAIDRYNEYQYLEIGGKAMDAHCLLSGGTGCGKSTTLHALIMQIVRNYHPDEAEIWAIDCKGVEFNRYIETNTPHFRLIACGSETEMLLNVIDKIWEEYLKRIAIFGSVGVQDLEDYRKKMGSLRAMPRIFVVIDEFHMMTAAAFKGSFDGINYSDRITEIIKLVRATGIILLLSSQTVTMGLKGFNEDAKAQAGARLCMKHDATNTAEIRMVLSLTDSYDHNIIENVAHFGKGQLYKKIGSSLVMCNSLWIDNWKQEIEKINELIGDDYIQKECIFALSSESMGNSKRMQINKMTRHPIQKFVNGDYTVNPDGEVEWYPAGPITLEDYFRKNLSDAAGENMLVVGNNKELTDSVIFFSILGFLMDPNNKIVINFVNPADKSRQSLYQLISKINCKNLTINTEFQTILDLIMQFEKIPSSDGTNTIYFWFGLNKLENEIINYNEALPPAQNEDDSSNVEKPTATQNDQFSNDLQSILDSLGQLKNASPSNTENSNLVSYTKITQLLQKIIERGPDNKLYNFVYFKTYKELLKTGIVKLQEFERRIGSSMSVDDSSDLFGSGAAISKTDDDTVIYYGGSGSAISLRPYHLPDDEWINSFNKNLNK